MSTTTIAFKSTMNIGRQEFDSIVRFNCISVALNGWRGQNEQADNTAKPKKGTQINASKYIHGTAPGLTHVRASKAPFSRLGVPKLP
ncbi:hypothetical protein AAFF_G00420040 [Aldrovandia affinis]|uniref:Uncharacterized protein n=1 Tax=Aldrovandia affinis TaxID=143900 RepID=A0AAD7SA32_9TELE|nr:hypothetical protein AAFF_G00420040 [Aldrovandia affinis]